MSKAKADPRGWPDYTYPMTIIGQELNVAIDIAAQSLPTLNVSIAASDVTLDVNIASSAVTLNVNIESISEGVTFNVAQSGTWTVNAAQTGAWTINIGAPLDASGYLQTHIMDSVQLDVNIAASAVTLDVNIASSAVTLNVKITDSTVTLNVNIESIASGVVFNVAQSGTWTINAVQSGDWSINIESVSAGVTFNVNITGSTVTLDVNITGSTATLDVNIASSSVAINIKTETGANIVIDKLVESAYTEERRVLANNGDTPIMLAPGTSYRRGKYFPRGCRGFIHQIEVYCDNQESIDRKLYIYVAPQPGMAPIISTSLTVPASSSPAWRSKAVNKYWNYDSLFIWVLSETNSNPRVGYDEGAPPDYYDSTDGETWFPANRRLWIRLNMTAQTVGDLPVTGTLNTIEVPNVSTYVESGEVAVPPGEEVTVAEVSGAGRMINCFFRTDYNGISYRIYIDDVKVWDSSMIWLKDYGLDNAEEKLRLLKYDETNDIYTLWDTRPFPFTRKLEVRAVNPSTSTVVVEVKFNAELIR